MFLHFLCERIYRKYKSRHLHTLAIHLKFFNEAKGKSKFVAVPTAKACTESGRTVTAILNLGTIWTGVVNLTVQPLKNPVLIEQKARWTPEAVWMFWKRKKTVATTGMQIPDCPARNRPTVPIMLLLSFL